MGPELHSVSTPPEEEPLDDASFERFFEANRGRLYGSLCLITGNRHEAEEIVQDAFLKMWERWDRVSGLEDPVGFLFRTAMNLFRNRARRAALAVRKVARPALRSDDLATVEDRDELVRMLHRLTERQRAAIVLTEYLGFASDEAATILGIRASTVRALSTQGRTSVRQTQGGSA